VHERDFDSTSRGPGSEPASSATGAAKQATETAKQSAQEIAGTAKEQGRQVAGQIGSQARSVVSDVRTSVAGQARTQNDRLAGSLRQLADDLSNMHGGDTSSPAGQVVQRLGDTGRRAADYLQDKGPEGLLEDVQDFARRKPGTFLLAAAAAGFVIGRLGRTTISAARESSSHDTSGQVYASNADYAAAPPATSGLLDDPYAGPSTGTGYAVSTGPAGTTAVGTAPVEPTGYPSDPVTGYPSDPVGVPERGIPR